MDTVERSHTGRHGLAGFLAASGLLLVAYAVLANLSTTVTIQQTLYRGYLLLLVPLLGFLLAALALAGQVGAALEREPAPGGRRAARRLARLSDWGSCLLWMAAWAAIFYLNTRLL